MSNIYFKATIEKNWRFQNLDFLILKKLSLGPPTHAEIIEY